MVYIQLPISGVSGTVATLVPVLAADGTSAGTTTQVGEGPIKQVFQVPYFGKYHVKILGCHIAITNATGTIYVGGFTISSHDVYYMKSTVLNNPGSPVGLVGYTTSAPFMPHPLDLGVCYINGFIDYEIGLYNPNNALATPANFNTVLRSSTQTGSVVSTIPYYPFRHSILTLELTKIEE